MAILLWIVAVLGVATMLWIIFPEAQRLGRWAISYDLRRAERAARRKTKRARPKTIEEIEREIGDGDWDL